MKRKLGRSLGKSLGRSLSKFDLPFYVPYKSDAARWLQFKSGSLSVIDRIGDETRPIQTDGCLTGDTVNTITFNAAINGIKYCEEDFVFGSAIDVSATHIWTIPSVNVCFINGYSDAACTTLIAQFPVQEKADTTIFDVLGGYHSVLSADSVRNTTIFDISVNNWSNQYGYNKAAYFDSTAKIIYDVILNGTKTICVNLASTVVLGDQYIFDNRFGGGLGYLYIAAVSKVLTASSGTIYVDGVATNIITNKTKEVVIKGITLTGTKLYVGSRFTDIEKITTNIAGFSIYDGNYLPSELPLLTPEFTDSLNGSTIGTATNVDFDRITLPAPDLFGRTDLYSGKVKYNAEIIGGTVGIFAGAQTIDTGIIITGNSFDISFCAKRASGAIVGGAQGATTSLRTAVTWFSDNKIYVLVGNVGSLVYGVTAAIVKTSATKIRAVYDGTQPTNETKVLLYVDDVLTPFASFVGTIPSTIAASVTTFKIGQGTEGVQFSVGEISSFKINATHDFELNGNSINSVTGIAATNTGVTFAPVLDYTPQSTIDWLRYGGIKRDYADETPIVLTISSGTPTIVGKVVTFLNEVSLVRQNGYWTIGKTYRVEVKVEDYIGAGNIYLPYDLNTVSAEQIATANGTYIYNVIPTSVNMGIYSFAGHTAKVTIISINEVYDETKYIVNPKFAAFPLDVIIYAKGYNNPLGAVIEFDPIVWSTYKSYGLNMNNLVLSLWSKGGVVNDDGDGVYFAEGTSANFIYRNLLLTTGKTYRYLVYAKSTVAGDKIDVYGGSNIPSQPITLTTDYVWYAVEQKALGSTLYCQSSAGTGDAYISEIIVQEVTEHIDAPNRSGNKVINGTFDTDTDWTKGGNWTINTTTKVAEITVAGVSALTPAVAIPAAVGTKYIIFYDKTTSAGALTVTYGGQTFASGDVKTATTTGGLAITSDASWLGSIDDIRVFKLEYTNAIGYIAHVIFNRLAYVGNAFGLPEIWDGDAAFLADTDITNPYIWEDITPAYLLTHVEIPYEGFIYELINSGGNLTDLVVYEAARNDSEQLLKLSKWLPQYSNLMLAMLMSMPLLF